MPIGNINKIKVLFLVSNYPSVVHPYRGVFFRKIAEGLARNSFIEVSVITPIPFSNKWIERFFKTLKGNHKIVGYEAVNNVYIYRPRYLRLPFMHKLYLSHVFIFPRVSQIVKIIKPDLVDFRTSYSPYPLSRIAVLIKSKFKIPFIYTINGAHLFPHEDKNDRRVFDFITMIQEAVLVQSVSLELKKSVKLTISREPLLTVHPIDLNETFIPESREFLLYKFGLPQVSNYLFFAGQLSYEKGVDRLINAFLKGNYKNTILLLAGDGPLLNCVDSSDIYFLGKVGNKEVMQLMKISTQFVFLTKFEGMPNVLKEAGAMKLPIITTNVGGIPELLNYGERGTIIKNEDEANIIESIRYAIVNPKIGIAKAEKLYQHVLNEFDILKTNKKLIETYMNILNND